MEHVQPFEGPFPWRAAALAAAALALAELTALLALTGLRLFPAHPPATARTPATTPTRVPAAKPAAHPLRPRSHVSVLVLNGNGIAHAAGDEAARLLGRGYRRATATDAPSHTYQSSLVLFRRGWEQEARRLAHDAGIRVVAPLDGRLPAADARYPVVLILGAR